MHQINITQLSGVGPKTAARLNKIGIQTVQDLLLHLPFRYEDRTKIIPIAALRVGLTAGIVGEIVSFETINRARPMLLCCLKDQTAILKIRFFNYPKLKLQFIFKPGMRLYCYGELRFVGHDREMIHPEFKILTADAKAPVTTTYTPVYPSTDGLPQAVIRKLIDQALHILQKSSGFVEYLPEDILRANKLGNINDAIRYLHAPPLNMSIFELEQRSNPLRERLIFEELLATQLSLQNMRKEIRCNQAEPLMWQEELNTKFLATLPFALTAAQTRVTQEISQDLAKAQPMLRLMQGDVGCGKTIVAAEILLQAVHAGFQALIMVPTEILAEQHYQNISRWLKPFNFAVALITGKSTGNKRKKLLATLANGEANIIIGTHALFQEKIQFANLALVIVDEQHRFGVHQRLVLRDKGFKDGKYPHQLIMTATPIPRTLAMTVYADLDCSVIDELPSGRMKVTTAIVSNKKREQIIAKVREYCSTKQQVYWVCPLIEESEILQCKAAETTYAELKQKLPELRVGLIHGRMQSVDKEQMMQTFKAGEIDILVATTVIEVGVDVPNANLMIIENAERMGLVQLHQLRGRIGRGKVGGNCVLIYQAPLSEQARKRLEILRETNDGFIIARKDLELRGPGEVLGTKQTGLLNMRIADLLLDQKLLPQVQETAVTIMQQYPETVSLLIERWLGHKEKYAAV